MAKKTRGETMKCDICCKKYNRIIPYGEQQICKYCFPKFLKALDKQPKILQDAQLNCARRKRIEIENSFTVKLAKIFRFCQFKPYGAD